MSDLPADALTYEAVVGEYFLGLRGAGLVLSPLDQELVAEWERRGFPVAVVCRGLRRGLESWLAARPGGAGAPRSLRAYRLAVEDEWRAYASGRVGAADGPGDGGAAARARLEAAHARVVEAGRLATGALREAYREAYRALAAAGGLSLEEVDPLLAALDARLLAAFLRGLDRAERSSLGPRCRLAAGRRTPGMRPRAYRETLRAHLVDAAREAGLTCLAGWV